MVSATTTTTPDSNLVAKTTLKSLQQDPVVQSERKSLMDSLGDPILLGLTGEQQDPAQPLLGTSGDARIVLKTAQDKKLSLEKMSFSQWSAANFRIMHTLMTGWSLLSS